MKKKQFSPLVFIVLLGLVLRLISINQSFWLDEATSAIVALDMKFGQILTDFSPGDFHPPLYYLTLRTWYLTCLRSQVFGASEVSFRLLSIIFGLLTIVGLYKVGEIIKNKTVGTLAALFLATSPLFIYYSQEVRMYPMATFLVTFSAYFLVKSVNSNKFHNWMAYAFSVALLGMTDYLPLFVLPVFALWIWVDKKRRKLIWKFVSSHVILLIVFVVFWPIMSQQLSHGLGVKIAASNWWSALGQTSLKNIVLIPVKFMIGRIGFQSIAVYLFVVGFVGTVFLYALKKAAKTFKKQQLIWFWLFIPIGLTVVVGFFVPVLSYFRLLFVLPAFYLVVSVGVINEKKARFMRIFSLILAINLLTSGFYLANERFHREDWRGLVEFINQESVNKSSRVIFVADSQMEGYKYYADDEPSGPDGIEEGLDQIWLMRYVVDIFDPNNEARKKVEELGYNKVSEHDFNGVVVWRYEK